MKKIVTALIVTYADRCKYLQQVVTRLISEEIDKIVIINNAASEATKEYLNKISKSLKLEILILNNTVNLGSAAAINRGLHYISEDLKTDLVWILDDDNLPENGSLNKLLFNYEKLNNNEKTDICLVAHRPEREIYLKKAKTGAGIEDFAGRKNSFYGYDFRAAVLKKINIKFFNKLKSFYKKTKKFKQSSITNDNYLVTPVAPYGGMFFSIHILNKIGLPDNSYFLYGDDYDFSYRITLNDGKIIIIPDAVIKDLDVEEKKNETVDNINYIKRKFYHFRNTIYFHKKNLINNHLIYNVNKYFYLRRLNSSKLEDLICLEAVKDIDNGKMGEKDFTQFFEQHR